MMTGEYLTKIEKKGLQLILHQALANHTVQGVWHESLQLLPLVELVHSDDFDLLYSSDDEYDNLEAKLHHDKMKAPFIQMSDIPNPKMHLTMNFGMSVNQIGANNFCVPIFVNTPIIFNQGEGMENSGLCLIYHSKKLINLSLWWVNVAGSAWKRTAKITQRKSPKLNSMQWLVRSYLIIMWHRPMIQQA